MNKVHYSSRHKSWETPDDFFRLVDRRFRFTLDVCATSQTAKVAGYFSPQTDGLAQSWAGEVCFMNPPYGRGKTGIVPWVAKAHSEAAENGATVACLLPARTDTAWWHAYASRGEIYFMKGRLRFKGAADDAPFPSALVIFWPPGHPDDRSGSVWWWDWRTEYQEVFNERATA
jgi:site-specific DNA-methyltransferase (adenine-specific)